MSSSFRPNNMFAVLLTLPVLCVLFYIMVVFKKYGAVISLATLSAFMVLSYFIFKSKPGETSNADSLKWVMVFSILLFMSGFFMFGFIWFLSSLPILSALGGALTILYVPLMVFVYLGIDRLLKSFEPDDVSIAKETIFRIMMLLVQPVCFLALDPLAAVYSILLQIPLLIPIWIVMKRKWREKLETIDGSTP